MRILTARILPPPPFLSQRPKAKGARRQGQLYENRVQEFLSSKYSQDYLPGPWIRYFTEAEPERERWMQPDGILRFRDKIVVIEVKLRHTAQAFLQLSERYLPAARFLYPNSPVCPVEMVKWYDCATPFPVPIVLRPDPTLARATDFQVTIWNPRK